MERNRCLSYPLYDVCYKMKDGSEKVIAQGVTLQKGIACMKKFDQVLVSGRSLIEDVLYCFLLPLLDKKPVFDIEEGSYIYK